RLVTQNFTACSVVGLDAQERHELEAVSSCAVLARLPAFNIMRHPHYNSHSPRRSPAHYAARLEPPAQYDHPYNGPVVERVVPEAEVRSLCMSMGANLGGVACSLHSNGTCYIVLPSDERAPAATFRRHEIAHCNGWPANHPHDG